MQTQQEEQGQPQTDGIKPQLDQSLLGKECKQLWDQYFASPKKNKPALMEQYNTVAAQYNSIVGFDCMTIINSTTKDSIKTRPTIPPEIDQQETATPQPQQAKKEAGGAGIIQQIIEHHKQGLTNKEIIAKGFNKSTVGRQISEYKKKQNEQGISETL
jgi:hypothetical protein